MRKTKIICTLGPASGSEEKIRELILAGMNVARFNFSHGSHEQHKTGYDKLMKISSEMGLPIAVLLDTKGPEIRLKSIEGGKTELATGQKFILTADEVEGNNERVSITYKDLKNDISVGTTVLIDDGLIEMIVEAIEDADIVCKVVNGGKISDHKGVNVPGVVLSIPYISEADRSDIIFGCEIGFDYLAASFTRCKEDILQVREIIKENNGTMKIIAKIENMQGVSNLDEILEVADGIMVARGDMGVEVPFEDIPHIQKTIIAACGNAGKIVVTATQMLESMIQKPRPTRAEITDVANAIYDGTSAIMLSGETASGKYPLEALKTMSKIALKTESYIDYRLRMAKNRDNYNLSKSVTYAVSHAAATTAHDLNAAVIVAVTRSGSTARMIARYRPAVNIIAVTPNIKTYYQLAISWGVDPIQTDFIESTMAQFGDALKKLAEYSLVKDGDLVVITGSSQSAIHTTNAIHIHTIGKSL